MCGRFTLATPASEWADLFRLDAAPDVLPRYNIAPTQDVVVIRSADAGRRASLVRWGLVPHWAREVGPGPPLINARSETVSEKPSFRDAYRERRCLVVADGFYEWKAAGRSKQPFWIGLSDGRPFAFAGLWDRWNDPKGRLLDSCAILTTDANPVLAELHDRMPVMLHPDSYDTWLAQAAIPWELEALLRPYPSKALRFFPVSTRVNYVVNDDPSCLVPVQAQTELF